MSDGQKWILMKVPGLGDVIGWVDDSLLCERGLVEVENCTRLIPHPSGREMHLAKMGDRLAFNFMAIPLWMDAPAELVADVSKLWDRIIVPEKRILRHD